jgi:acetyl esterase/lipase
MIRQVNEDKMDKFNKAVVPAYPLNKESFMTRYRYFCHFAELTLAIVSKTLNRESNIMKILKLIWYAPLFILSQSRRQAQFKEFVSSGDLDLILKIAKFSGNDLSKFAFYWINPRIKFHQKIYIPKDYDELTTLSLNKCLENFILRKTDDSENSEYLFTKRMRGAESFTLEYGDKLKFMDTSFSYKWDRKKLMLRIVSPFSMNLNPDPSNSKASPKECDAILIHIHGGGFISMSSSQHQSYLRGWSIQNNIPVLMLTYTLSPEAEYPGALNDCWQAYRWIVDNMKKSLGIKPKKILISGDSAGGNLATALVGLAICHDTRIPDALISIYPALLLSPTIFTPSRINTFDDTILNNLMTSCCIKSYCQDLIAEEHPFLSPLFFPNVLLKRFPKVRMSLAGIDPLHDDGYQFAYKMVALNKDIRVVDNKLLPHGFLNFGLVPLIGGE